LPSVTWPSPPNATSPLRRIETIVVIKILQLRTISEIWGSGL
jgi:hypothetical protein